MASNAPPSWLAPQLPPGNGNGTGPGEDAFLHRDMSPAPAPDPNDWRWLDLPVSQPASHTADIDANSSHEEYHDAWTEHREDAPTAFTAMDTQFESESAQVQRALELSNDDFVPHSWNPVPLEMSCMAWYPQGNATITYTGERGTVEAISNLNPWIIEERCPLIAQAFEDSASGPRLHLEALTPGTVHPFLRYLYTGTYALNGQLDRFEDVPSSVLLHCQLYRLGDIYDVPDLKSQAYVNVIRQCEFGCFSPEMPIDLCPAIKFIYEHLETHAKLIDTIVNYCVSCFVSHNLGEDVEFKQVAYDLRPFHQALCRESMNRQFENETAAAIIRMPFKPYSPVEYASREDADVTRFNKDVVYHFHGADEFDHAVKKRKTNEGPSNAAPGPSFGGISLALRFSREQKKRKQAQDVSANDSISSDRDIPQKPADVVGHTKDAPGYEAAVVDQPAEQSEVPGEEGIDTQGRKSSASSIEDHPPLRRIDTDEAEFEFVAGPAPVEDVDFWSDSDTGAVMITERPMSHLQPQQSTLPIRARETASSSPVAARAGSAESGSDAEWDFL